MLIPHHRKILQEALQDIISPNALKTISKANARQDYLHGQLGHDEYHFDNNAFDESYAYIEENRAQIRVALKGGDAEGAWAAFGRLTHTAHDFYAHSNYIPLWLAQFDEASAPHPADIDHADQTIIKSAALRSGILYYPLELLSFIPIIKNFVMPHIPKDSHAWMNLDYPARGPMFAYTFAAAVKVTGDELEKALAGLSKEKRDLFLQ